MVVDSHREGPLGLFLTDHPSVKEFTQLARTGKVLDPTGLVGGRKLLLDDLVAQLNTFVTDVDPGASDELLDLLLTLTAKGTFEQVSALTNSRHPASLLVGRFVSIRLLRDDHPPEMCAVHLSYGQYPFRMSSSPVSSDDDQPCSNPRGSPDDRVEPHSEVKMSSIRPYSFAPWAVRYLSRSMSLEICSTL